MKRLLTNVTMKLLFLVGSLTLCLAQEPAPATDEPDAVETKPGKMIIEGLIAAAAMKAGLKSKELTIDEIGEGITAIDHASDAKVAQQRTFWQGRNKAAELRQKAGEIRREDREEVVQDVFDDVTEVTEDVVDDFAPAALQTGAEMGKQAFESAQNVLDNALKTGDNAIWAAAATFITKEIADATVEVAKARNGPRAVDATGTPVAPPTSSKPKGLNPAFAALARKLVGKKNN